MGSMDNAGWLFDAPLFDDATVADAGFTADAAFFLTPNGFNAANDPSVQMNSVQVNSSFVDCNSLKESCSRKRVRPESSSEPGSKACREKMRRDRLNDKFLELGSILEPGKPPKMDKAAILSDAVRMVTQLRGEAQKLKDSNESLQEKIKELKAEKNELRDEKQRLKVEKENLEQQIKILNSRPSFVPHPPVIPTTFAAQGQTTAHKLVMPVIGYPGFPMWQFMPPADVDTSQDAESCPPVA